MANVKKKTTASKTTKKSTKALKNSKQIVSAVREAKISPKFLEELKLSESYVSLMLGVVVVLVLSAVFFMFIRGGALDNASDVSESNSIPTQATLQNPRTYTLKDGEGLWDVAVKYYGDGYKWVEIAKANNLTEEQANQLGPGSKIIVPEIK